MKLRFIYAHMRRRGDSDAAALGSDFTNCGACLWRTGVLAEGLNQISRVRIRPRGYGSFMERAWSAAEIRLVSGIISVRSVGGVIGRALRRWRRQDKLRTYSGSGPGWKPPEYDNKEHLKNRYIAAAWCAAPLMMQSALYANVKKAAICVRINTQRICVLDAFGGVFVCIHFSFNVISFFVAFVGVPIYFDVNFAVSFQRIHYTHIARVAPENCAPSA